jgi:beta-lactamase regulating signal transducer with metallopeptidase domain
MEHFFINSSISLFVLWLAYKLLLENTSWHTFKRWYLLGALVFSLSIPLIIVKTVVIPIQKTAYLPYSTAVNAKTSGNPAQITTTPEFVINWWYIGLLVYAIGVIIMLWRFTKNLNSFRIHADDEISTYQTYQLILRNRFTIPHSFLHRIFVSKKDYESAKIPIVILKHEKAHLDQKHSLDILFIESLMVVLWFNPLIYIIKYAIKLNHEFLADRSVLNQGISTTDYQQILLDHATASYQQALANTFTFPIIKKRFYIMKTKTTHANLIFRSLALLPILTLLVIGCGKEQTEFKEIEEKAIEEIVEEKIVDEAPKNQKIITINPSDPEATITINGDTYTYKINGNQVDIYNKNGELQDFESQGYNIIQVVEVLEDLTQNDINEYNQLAIAYKGLTKRNKSVELWKKETTRLQVIYNSMNEAQKAKNEPWPFIGNYYNVEYKAGQIPPPPAPPAPPAPRGAIDYINANKEELNYYLGKTQITADKAIEIIEKYGQQGVEISPDANGINSIKIKDSKTLKENRQSQKETTARTPKSKSATSNTPSIYAAVENEPDTKDFKFRKMIIIASLNQNKPLAYKLNGKETTVNAIQKYLVNHQTADVTFIEGNQNLLQFTDKKGGSMTPSQLQDVYTKLFKYRPKENPSTFVLINETEWKVVTVDATVNDGTFERKGAKYRYDSSDLNEIKVYNKQGKELNKEEFKNLAIGFNIVWWQGDQKYKELLNQPEIIEGFKNGTYAVFYPGGYTKDYEKAIQVDASKTFLSMGPTLESITINLHPHAWAYSNPSLEQFQKYVD